MRLAPVLLSLMTLAAPGFARAADPPTIILESRLRHEAVDQSGLPNTASALTLRTRLGFETAPWKGVQLLIEGENVVALGEEYNSTTNGKTIYPIVPDPETTELNRLQLTWKGDKTAAVVGRQRIILGSARFVGNVGFRQNEQTFDAARLDFKPRPDLALTYAYVDRVQRVFGDDHPQGAWRSDSHLAQADWKPAWGHLTVHGEWLDFANAPAQSSVTLGASLRMERPLSDTGLKGSLEVAYARQADHGGNPADFGLDYASLSLGLRQQDSWGSVMLERLDGDGGRGFATPLATLHAFQGWADVFLITPPEGVQDLNAKVGATWRPEGLPPVRLAAAIHRFTVPGGGDDYGTELDLLAAAPLTPRLSFETKLAWFDGDRPTYGDRTKVWISLDYRY
ncbi:hypothetical protein [Phenylobacterium sp.]|jgi:hypothetical protein|uniref:hypothetical protein n=1 Tax=Phenylobacterium sp. TaxID=1871053 RepID=UPI000C894F42|nr:hypothetical protein [Phenylobacterium sp.]MAK80944.1 hypothetical protein [Phenylobacterium sp.]|tara:strand:+ start:10942 stop:12129 length:1188 start_codon:yes stop_codon:yes gene_type:complete